MEGPIALDIKQNFEERWRYLSSNHDVPLAEITEDEYALDAVANILEHEGGPWTMQLFRSINSDSCQFDDHRYSKLHQKGGRHFLTTRTMMMMSRRLGEERLYSEQMQLMPLSLPQSVTNGLRTLLLLDESCGAKLDFQDCFSCQKGVKTAAFFERNIFFIFFFLSFAIGGFITTVI